MMPYDRAALVLKRVDPGKYAEEAWLDEIAKAIAQAEIETYESCVGDVAQRLGISRALVIGDSYYCSRARGTK